MNELTEEQKTTRRARSDRLCLALSFMLFLAGWFVFLAILLDSFPMSAIEGLGLGTVTGVFLKAFSDMWQFWWRKKGPVE